MTTGVTESHREDKSVKEIVDLLHYRVQQVHVESTNSVQTNLFSLQRPIFFLLGFRGSYFFKEALWDFFTLHFVQND